MVKKLFALICITVVVVACGDGGTAPASGAANAATFGYALGGTVSGLAPGSGLVLAAPSLADESDNPIQGNGAFVFLHDSFEAGSSYVITVQSQPQSPPQHCVVNNPAGVFHNESINNISVICSGVGHYVYVVNSDDNTISAFSIDAATGTLTAVGIPTAAGASPRSIASSADGRHVYVLSDASDTISVYAVDVSNGLLTPTGFTVETGIDPQAMTLDPTGAYLYVANHGSNTVSAYTVEAASGNLTPLSTRSFATGIGPTAIAVERLGNLLFTANDGSNDISVFQITAGTGLLKKVPRSPFAAGGKPHSIALGNFGNYLYTANSDGGRSSISGFEVTWDTGALQAFPTSPSDLSVDNTIASDLEGTVLYVTDQGRLDGYVMATVDLTDGTTSGSLIPLAGSPVVAGSGAYSVAFDPSKQFVYVTNAADGTVSGYRFDLSSEGSLLTAVPGSPFAVGHSPRSLTII